MDKPIDIMQQFVDLYGREELLAFFDLTIERPGKPPISGLCRVSKPKGSGAKLHYLSLSFVADTPDDETRAAVEQILARLDADTLSQAVSGITGVVPMPSMSGSASSYVTQTDILLESEPDRQFIALRLLPAIRRLLQAKPTEVVWWSEDAEPAGRPAARVDTDTGLVDSIKDYLGKYFRSEKA
jgi:hypothetical protein